MDKPHLRYKNQTPKEQHWTIKLLACVKFLKGILLFVVAIKLLTLLDRDLNLWFADFIGRHRIDPENTLFTRLLKRLPASIKIN